MAEIVILICYGLSTRDRCYVSTSVVSVVEVRSLAAVGVGDSLDLRGGICAVNVTVGVAGAEDGAAAVLDRRPGAAAMTVIGYLLSDIAVAECGRTAVVVIGVCIAEALAAYALGQRRDIVLRIICPAEIMENNIVSVSLNYADKPVGAVVQIVFGGEQSPAGDCAVCYCDGLHLNADKLSFSVIGVIEAYALVVRAVREPTGEGVHIVVEVLPVVPVAVGLGGKRPRAGIVGVADEVPAAYVHRCLKVCCTVDEAVGRSLAAGIGMGQRREQVVCVAVRDRGVSAGGGQQPSHAVVAVPGGDAIRVRDRIDQ